TVSLRFDGRISDISLVRSLKTRQSGNIPSIPTECQSTCDPINAPLSAGCTVTACCTKLVEECAQQGISIPKLTFPGQDSNRTLSVLPTPTGSSWPLTTASELPSTLFTQNTISNLVTPTSSQSSQPTDSPSSGTSVHNYKQIPAAIFSAFLVGYWILLA
ncbi:hypothetical protein BDQ17DRAFT_1354997, partial [Cyathus striatus]